MAIKLGITGGIGSGKSVVSHLLEIMGIPVYISDIEAKRLTASDPFIRKQLTDLLGADLYKNGELNKPLLASYLFSNPDHAKKVNSIIHPRVKEDFRQWIIHKQKTFPIIATESAILIESGFKDEVDKLIMVYAPLETRIGRAVSRDSVTREAIIARIKNQMDDEEKMQYADYTIYNNDERPLIPQVINIIAEISKDADS